MGSIRKVNKVKKVSGLLVSVVSGERRFKCLWVGRRLKMLVSDLWTNMMNRSSFISKTILMPSERSAIRCVMLYKG